MFSNVKKYKQNFEFDLYQYWNSTNEHNFNLQAFSLWHRNYTMPTLESFFGELDAEETLDFWRICLFLIVPPERGDCTSEWSWADESSF